MGEVRSTFEEIESTLKKSAAALREAGLEFALAGSVACWARGAPQSRNDLDFLVRPEDAERGLEALTDAGMRAERPPEGWLLKAWDTDENGTLVDLIFGPRGITDVGEVLARAEIVGVAALDLPVVHLDDVMVMKLFAFDEHACDYSGILSIARAVREQVDWDSVRARTEVSPFARAFFDLLEGLGITGDQGPPPRAAQGTPRITVAGQPSVRHMPDVRNTVRAAVIGAPGHGEGGPVVGAGASARGDSVHEHDEPPDSAA
jgi:hypothetical protein